MCYNNTMKHTKDIKRTSLYIPLDFFAKVQKSADLHRRSFNQQLIWLAEQGLIASQDAKVVVER